MVVVLNKMDILQKRRITIDESKLANTLGCPVVALSAHNRQQVAAFKNQIQQFIGQPQPALLLDYGSELEKIWRSWRPCLPRITSPPVAAPCACWKRMR